VADVDRGFTRLQDRHQRATKSNRASYIRDTGCQHVAVFVDGAARAASRRATLAAELLLSGSELPVGPRIAKKAPDFTLRDVTGRNVKDRIAARSCCSTSGPPIVAVASSKFPGSSNFSKPIAIRGLVVLVLSLDDAGWKVGSRSI